MSSSSVIEIFAGRRHDDTGFVCIARVNGVLCVGHGETEQAARRDAKDNARPFRSEEGRRMAKLKKDAEVSRDLALANNKFLEMAKHQKFEPLDNKKDTMEVAA